MMGIEENIEEIKRKFYYPLQDKAEDLDRVVHDLVEITDDEESIDKVVKVENRGTEEEPDLHFVAGEAGEKQKPIEVSEWELPTGDGEDWVRPSCFYTPYQEGISYSDICSTNERQICVWFDDYNRNYSSDAPIDTMQSVIQGFGQARGYKDSTPSLSYNFGKISKQIFDNLFTQNGSIIISMKVNSSSYGYGSYYYERDYVNCYFEYDSSNNCYDAYVTINDSNIKVASFTFTGSQYNNGEINITRYYNKGLNGNYQWTVPQILIILTFHPVNENVYNFNSYDYYYGMAAKKISSYNQSLSAAAMWFADLESSSIPTQYFPDSSWSNLSVSLSTKQIVKAGIYSLGIIPKNGNADVVFLGTMTGSGNFIRPSGEPEFGSGSGMGITLKNPANIVLQNSGFIMYDSLIVMHSGARIDMSGDNKTSYTDGSWDGSSFAGLNQHTESPDALLHLHGQATIQMDNLSMIEMGGGAFLDMSGEAYFAMHGLSRIDISGAPQIHIHGNANKSGAGSYKYGLSSRQPEIALDDGCVISLSGQDYGDPYFIMKGYGGTVFNNNYYNKGEVVGGPLFVANEDSFYFDGYGSAGAYHISGYQNYPSPSYSANDFNELKLGTDTLDKYRDLVYEDIQKEVLLTGKCIYSEVRYGKLQEIFTRSEKKYQYNPITNYTGDYSSQTGNDLITYIQTHPNDKPNFCNKNYFYKANAYTLASEIVSEINSEDVTLGDTCISVNNVFNNQSIIENKFIEKGLNISDYIIEIGYSISWGQDTAQTQAKNNFTNYYETIHGTRTLERTAVVYRQLYLSKTDDFLNTYYNTSLDQISGVDFDSSHTYISMTQSAYNEINGDYNDYSQNYTSSSYYFTIDGQEITIKPYFSIQAKSYYDTAFPRFREKVYAANSIAILGGEQGSASWVKIGGDPGEFTKVLITNNAQIEFSQNSQFLMNGNTSLEITDDGITFTDSTGTVTFTAAQLAAIIAGGGSQLPNAEQTQF